MSQWYPLIVLGIGIATVLWLIIYVRANAFLALIAAAIVVSLLSSGAPQEKISRVASAFGAAAGNIGVVIALAAIIGKCMLDSGAADRIVRAFTGTLGEKRAPLALMGSGYVLAIPVFFDTVFYLLVPLARSLHKKTGKDYLKYILAISVGGALTHTLVPPTPGPLLMAAQLQVDLGLMMLVGAGVALPSALLGLMLCGFFDRWLKVPMRQVGQEPELQPLSDDRLPGLLWSILPVILPVIMISANTILTTIADGQHVARLQVADVAWDQLAATLAEGRVDEAARTARGRVAARVIEVVGLAASDGPAAERLLTASSWTEAEKSELLALLNKGVLENKEFHREEDFLGIPLPAIAKKLIGQKGLRMKIADAERLNRLLLESSWGEVIKPHLWETPVRRASDYGDLFGNANLALLLSGAIAMWVLQRQRGLTLHELSASTETALMSGGVIILITSAGGAFGAMLTEAKVGDAIQSLFQQQSPGQSAGLTMLLLGFGIAVVLKIAQGSSTVAMITGSSMLASLADPSTLGFHPVYLATAIGGGSLVGSWMNDSGFWIFAKMGGLTEEEALKSWTPMLAIIGTASFLISILLARLLPLV